MSMEQTATKPPRFDSDGNHWELHGETVFESSDLSDSGRTLPARISALSRSSKRHGGVVALSINHGPFFASFLMTPEDTDALIDNLRAAALQARVVREIKAKRGAK
ncbi:MAG: hypothetical protein FWG56_12090 [Desulfovibrionaceae bacterium]|jgi:hypothetical protein|nr:hypothetical protein [Desulfovibrionaceae bacterium]